MSLEGCRIGLVEDDPIMGGSLTQRLAIEGAEVVWWRGRTDALRGLREAPAPRVVLCDLRLPDGSGEDLYLELRRGSAPPRFLFMTAYPDIDQAVRLMKAGASDFMTKPFEMDALLARLGALLGQDQPTPSSASLRSARGAAERVQIERALSETGGHLGGAARLLNVSRTTLWTRMRALGIERPKRFVQKS
jgi:DNA-binding NtrC family response regulator